MGREMSLSMGGVSIPMHVLLWCVAFAPYFASCFCPARLCPPAAPAWRRRLFQFAFPPAFCAASYFITRFIPYSSVFFLLANFGVCILGCVWLGRCVGQSFFRTLYRVFPGLIFSMCLSLSLAAYIVFALPANSAAITVALAPGAVASALLCALCLKATPIYVDPFLAGAEGSAVNVFCLYPLLFFCMMLLFNAVSAQSADPHWEIIGYGFSVIGVCGVYFLNSVIAAIRKKNLGEAHQSALLAHALQLQRAQYSLLGDRVEQTRKARHDLRFHLQAIERFALSRDTEGLLSYISQLKERAGVDEALSGICDNYAVEAVAGYYLSLINKTGAVADVSIRISNSIPFPAADLCVIWGNCMENAMEALSAAPEGNRLLRIRAEETEHTLTVLIGNTYAGERKTENGVYPSTKHGDGHGVGLESVTAVVKRHNGAISIETKEGLFMVSILLFLPPGREAAGEEASA